MGDYSRTSILTQINSGTVIGVSSHVFGQGTPLSFIPSFTWGGVQQFAEYELEKALDAATVFRSFKNFETGEDIRNTLISIFNQSGSHRIPSTL
jgi:hypothetical protein